MSKRGDSNRMKLLCLTDIRFWVPNNGSDRRIAGMLEYLAPRSSILVWYPGEVAPGEARRAVRRFPWLRLFHQDGIASRAGDDRGRPGGTLDEVVASERPDVLLAEYFWMTRHLKACRPETLRGLLTVLDTHDVIHRRTEAFAARGIDYGIALSKAGEAFFLDHYDWILAIQEEEAEIFRTMTKRPVLTVTHGNPVAAAPRTGYRDALRLGIVASKGQAQYHSLRWFLDEIWTPLRRVVPGLELHVFGTIGERLPDGELPVGVFRRGFATNLGGAYGQFDAAINPALFGSGINIKSVEALCHGKPLLSTTAGLFGLPAGNPAPFLRCDDFAAWSGAVRRLWHEAGFADDCASVALAYAQRHFSPEAAYGAFARKLGEAVALPARPGREIDTQIRASALLAREGGAALPPIRARSAETRPVFILGAGPRAALVRACLPAKVDVVAHLEARGRRDDRLFLGKPVLPPSAWPPAELDAPILDGRESGDTDGGDRALAAPDPWLQRLVVFGTGEAARLAANAAGLGAIIAFADNDRARQGKPFLGRPVVAPEDVPSLEPGRVVIASMHHAVIRPQLTALGIAPGQIGVFDVTQWGPGDGGGARSQARDRAAFFFDWPEDRIAPLLTAFQAVGSVAVAACDGRTVAAAIAARMLGCAVSLHAADPALSPLARLGIEVTADPCPDGEGAALVIAPAGHPPPGPPALAASIDANGRVEWRGQA